jgi:molybdate transport system substrate-binding protein
MLEFLFARKIFGVVAFSLALTLIGTPIRAQERPALLVFAAASLSNVLKDIGDRYKAQTGNEVVFSFAGSMTLARQIEASSGVDVFVSADLDSMNYLEERGLILSSSRKNLLQNELVLIAPVDSSVQLSVMPGFALAEALQGGRLAVANSVSVPAGIYANAALNSLGVWDSVSRSLAEGEDVRAALSFVARADAPLGIVYASDALVESRVRIVARFPASSHKPILYPSALTREARPGAQAFLDFLQSDDARMFFQSAGFTSF